MLLAIDAGNTNIVFALYDGAERRTLWRCATEARRTADEYAVWLLQLMQLVGLGADDVEGAIISSVVPAATPHLDRLCSKHFAVKPMVVGAADVKLGIDVLLDRPEEVGADRLVNAIAGRDMHKGAFIVIDFGTATTFDVVNEAGAYCGGVIAPGINLSAEALYQAAAKLPRVEVQPTQNVIGTNTVDAMRSGLYWGYVGLIEGLVARIKAETGVPMKVIATGGLAPMFASGTTVIQEMDGDLTLRGLQMIYERNKTR